jgi:glycosyltransferase involved in cell wall biosynthesis
MIRKLRIVTLVDTIASFGGAEIVAARTTALLNANRFERTLCASRDAGGFLTDELHASGVRVIALGRRARRSPRGWLSLLRLLRRERIDVLHTHKFGSNVWGTVLGRLAGVPVLVAHEHSWAGEEGWLRHVLDRHVIARYATVFLTVTDEDARRMVEIEGIAPAHIRVLRNAVASRPEAPSEAIRAEFGVDHGATVVGAVGRLSPVKRFDVLIEAAALLIVEHPDLRVVLIGDGEDEARLRALVAERGLTSVVRFTGSRTDVPEVLAALDIAVNCSDHEGSPLAVIEYMAAGLPVVATRVGGLPELVVDGESGFLVPPRDPVALASTLDRLIRDGDLRRRLGERARHRQRTVHDLHRTVRLLELLYEELYVSSRRGLRERQAATRFVTRSGG